MGTDWERGGILGLDAVYESCEGSIELLPGGSGTPFIGDGTGDKPESDISVLVDSAPGDATFFHPKKEVILLPGVFGNGLKSFELEERLRESTRRGGGRVVGRDECSGP